MVDITEILVHWHAGRSKNEIADSLGVSRNTVRKYVAPAEAAGIAPGGMAISSAEWAARVREWFPELTDIRLRQVTWPTIEQHRDYIVAQLKAGVTVTTIHQRLRDEEGLAVSIASMRRYVHANLPEEVRASQVRVLRLREAEPGEQGQIDYGQLGRWTDPKTGRRHMVQAFVMVLPASRHMFVYPVLKMDQQAWSSAHVAAFAFFGGCPTRLVPDNLKTGVDRPDLYDPKINRAYAELAAHYGVLVDPARSRKPRDKASVERPMPYIRDSFWRGRTFASMEEMREQAARWCIEVAGARACRPLADAAPLMVFDAIEAERLAPLPATPFVLSRWSKAKVGPDIHARVERVLYSIPWRYLGRQLDVRSTATKVQFFLGGELIKTHPRKLAGKQTDLADYPPEKVAFHMRTPAWCRSKAEQIGPACIEVIADLLGGERVVSAPRRSRGARPGRQAQPRAPGSRLRQGAGRRRPLLPDRQGHLGRGHRDRPRAGQPRRRRRRCFPARPRRPVRRRLPGPHRRGDPVARGQRPGRQLTP
ncbi:IS21 family transposase [Nonomuraea sp. NPDC003707]